MKILHIIPTLAKGGAEKMVLDICEELSQRAETEVQLIVLSDENTFDLEAFHFPILFIPSTFRLSLFGSSELKSERLEEAINNFAPNVIHTHLFDAELIARQNIRRDCAYFTHAHWNTKELRKSTWKFWLSKQGWIDYLVYRKVIKLYESCDNHFITISKDTDAFYRENLPGFGNKIHLLFNAINTTTYAGEKNVGDKMKIISIGRLNKRKNQRFQLEIAAILMRKGMDFEWTIVGEGADEQLLENKISELGLHENVNLFGSSNEIPKLLNQHRLFVHTATYEPFGLVIIEAMAAGLPVVSLNGGGNSELIEHGVNGFLLDTEDPNGFADQLIVLHKDSSLYEKVSQEGEKTAKKYDIRPYVDQLLELYRKAK